MEKSFAEEFDKACKKLGNNGYKEEIDRVHRANSKDEKHAFRNVDMPKPDPWKQPTHLTGLSL